MSSLIEPRDGQPYVHLTQASTIKPRPVKWLWAQRLALHAFSLLGGREGIGKSTLAYVVAAGITRGTLRGEYFGTPRNVIVGATEDSWAHTIVPRLMGAGADLQRVYRVDVAMPDGTQTGLTLPRDIPSLEAQARDLRAVWTMLDPLTSRLSEKIDTHADAETRRGLEPLQALADSTGMAVTGLIHVNKSKSEDVLNAIMGSKAFVAVARSVLFVMTDPTDDRTRLVGLAKNNLGTMDVPTLKFTIDGAKVAETPEGDVWTGKLTWTGESDQSIREAFQTATSEVGDKTATSEAGDWLLDYLTDAGGMLDSAVIKKAGKEAGHGVDALKRARVKLKIASISQGFPRRTFWSLPPSSLAPTAPTTPTALTAPTAPTEYQSVQLAQLEQLGEDGKPAPTDEEATDVNY